MRTGVGVGVSKVTPAGAWRLPGADWAADFERGLYFADGQAQAIGGVVGDTRASEILLPDAGGILRTVASGQPARTSKGLGVYGAATNKVVHNNHNPISTAAFLSNPRLTVVDDVASLEAAGLLGVCTAGKVFKIDNSDGVTWTYAVPNGAVGNTNPHTMSVYVRGDAGDIRTHYGEAQQPFSASAGYVRRINTFTPAGVDRKMTIAASAGSVVYFILAQLEEGEEVSPPIKTTSAAVTRVACEPLAVQGRGPELYSGQPFSVAGHYSSFDGNVATPSGVSWGCYVSTDINVVAGHTYATSTIGQGTDTRWAHSGAQDFTELNAEAPVVIPAGKTKLRIGRQVDSIGLPSPTGKAELHSVSAREVTPFPGYDPAQPDLTFAVSWDEVTVTAAKRVLGAYALNSTDYVELYLDAAGALKLGSVTSSTDRGTVTVAGKDDGLTHKAVCTVNLSTGALALSADGASAVTGTASAMPASLVSSYLGHNNNTNHVNGIIKQASLASADRFDAWR